MRHRRVPPATLLARSVLLATTALLPAASVFSGQSWGQSVAPGAAPSGGAVVAGSASIAQSANRTQITQSTDRAAIDWRQFNVGSDHRVDFQQPSAASWTLNRVTGPDPSVIAGKITANGGIALVNPSGVVFAQGSEVNVASLIASGADIANHNFMAGRMIFDGPGKPGARIENRGSITVADRGLAALVGPEVANRGMIHAKMGRVVLAGADAYTLDLAGDGLISIDVTQAVRAAPGGAVALVTNSGTIQADGGAVLLTAHAASGLMETLVSNTGRISTATLPASAGAPERAGTVALTAVGGGVRVDGPIDARGGRTGAGGTVLATADGAVTLGKTARIDVSGGTGGGRAFIGTSGVGRDQRLAARATVAKGAVIRADARGVGNGGTIAINSQADTAFAGRASARGGKAGGNGGLVETSGQGALSLDGAVDVRAPAGRDGTLLLDPQNIAVVQRTTETTDPVAQNGGTVLAASAPSSGTLLIAVSNIQDFSGTVRLEATNNITVGAQIGKSNGGLQLVAQNGLVDVQAPVTTTGDLSVTGASVQVRALLLSQSNTTVTSTVGRVDFDSTAIVGAGSRVTIAAQTDFRNMGTISGGTVAGTTSNAVQVLAGGTIINNGVVLGTGGGAPIPDGGTVAAVFLQAHGDIMNTGTITASARPDGTGGILRLDTAGVNSNINGSAAIAGGSIANAGPGRLQADHQVSVTANDSIVNSGNILGGAAGGRSENAVNLAAGTSVSNAGTVVGIGGGQLFNNNTQSVDAVTISAGTYVTNRATIQSVASGANYGSVSINAGGEIINNGVISAARNGLISSGDSITTTGTIEALTGRVEIASGGVDHSEGSFRPVSFYQNGGVIRALGAPPPDPPPTNAGSVLITASTGDINIYNASSVQAAKNITVSAPQGEILLDGFATIVSLKAGRAVRAEAGLAMRIDSTLITADTLVARAGTAAGSREPLDLDGAQFAIGSGMLLAAPGGITDTDGVTSSIRALDPAQLPVVIFDSRASGALTSLPPELLTDRPGSSANAQPTQLGQFGPAGGAGADIADLLLDAGQSPLFLLAGNGNISGFVNAGRLGVLGRGGSADLFGSLGGLGGGSASASLAAVNGPTTSAEFNRYQFNACVFASVNCVAVASTQPQGPAVTQGSPATPGEPATSATSSAALQVVPLNVSNVLANISAAVAASTSLRTLFVPQPQIVRFRSLRGRLADPDVLLPNIVEEDY